MNAHHILSVQLNKKDISVSVTQVFFFGPSICIYKAQVKSLLRFCILADKDTLIKWK